MIFLLIQRLPKGELSLMKDSDLQQTSLKASNTSTGSAESYSIFCIIHTSGISQYHCSSYLMGLNNFEEDNNSLENVK